MMNLHMGGGSETISISIGVGADARTASSIVLPRGHDLVKHLERLLPAMAKTVEAAGFHHHHHHHEQSTGRYQPQPHMQQQYTPSRGFDMRQQQPPHFPQQYMEHPHSPYHSDASSNGSTPPASIANSSNNGSMTHQYAGVRRRRGPTGGQGAGKKCQFPNCEKISVSRGLCRGHGGGRRCQHAGCSKGAQSRSDFCWAHGGGQRCEVKNCMRSRKTKRFCVAHLSWEGVEPQSESHHHTQQQDAVPASHRAYEQPKAIMPKLLAPYISEPATSPQTISFPALSTSAKLPSLQQALLKNQCVSSSGASSSRSGFGQHQAAVLNSASG